MTAENLKPSEYNVLVDYDANTHLAYNARTGAFVKIREDEYERTMSLLESPGTFVPANDREHELVEKAVHGGFLVEKEKSEFQLVKFNSLRARYSSENFYLTILPTLQCNMACPYCYEARETGKMSRKDQDNLLKWARYKIDGARRMSVGWFGGEPLLAYDVLRRLSRGFIRYCEANKKEYNSSMTTNAYLLSPEIADQLPALRVNLLQVTLDGPPGEHNIRRRLRGTKDSDTFTTIIGNLKYVAETQKDIKIVLRVNYDENSYSTIPEIFPHVPDVVRERSTIYFRQVFPPPTWWDENRPTKKSSVGENRDHLDNTGFFYEAIDQGFNVNLTNLKPTPGYCEADYLNSLVVDHKCNVHKCTVAFDEKHRLGYVNDDGEVDFDVELYAKWMVRDTYERNICADCVMLPTCMGGCSFTTLCAKGREICNTQVDGGGLKSHLKILYYSLVKNRERQALQAGQSA